MNEVCKTTANITINQTKSTPRSTITGAKKGKIIKVWNNVKVKDHAKEVLKTLQNIVKK